ncbi:structural protein [Collimonas humicola]|uniref:hypothetical protein n=1 Tax=Collimonas humicola TaxID=2825886 RepID=UPI001B8B40CF|nr:hypothetical protein [Collimonas humicola]
MNLLRFGAGVRAKVLAILQRMEVDLTARLVSDQLTDLAQGRAASLLKETSGIIGDYYAEIDNVTRAKMGGLAKVEAAAVRGALKQAIKVALDVAMPTPNVLATLASDALIHGAPSAAWWERQAGDTTFRFSNEVRQGIAQAETNSQIVARIIGKNGAPGVMDISRTSASRLVQASVQTVANEARTMTFQQNKDIVDGLQQISTLDGHTSDICIAYSGAMWDMNYEPMGETTLPYNGGCPRHWGCRSLMVPVTKSFKDMGIDLPEFPMSTRASRDGQVGANMTFKEWLAGRTDAQLDQQLGKGRAQLYRDGTITLQQLLDQSGNPLSLAQLLAKYES